MKNIAIFASGEGTNAQSIIDYFRNSSDVKVKLIVSNKENANVLNRAIKENISSAFFNKIDDAIILYLNYYDIDFIVLAGFLLMIPDCLLKAFPNKIINIHPSLLPKFGGRGMYGMNVHKAIIESKEKESGITIHYVNENYDEGKIISQHKCMVNENDTIESLANKIHELEYKFYPEVIKNILNNE